MQPKLQEVLHLLQRAFIINKRVKQRAYSDKWRQHCTDYRLRDHLYGLKETHIKKAIRLIRKHQLPIKYGKTEGVVFFQYLGEQVSFHDPFDQIDCKTFKGKWIGRGQKRSPFARFITSSRAGMTRELSP